VLGKDIPLIAHLINLNRLLYPRCPPDRATAPVHGMGSFRIRAVAVLPQGSIRRSS
jgi:hypothetical protein